eukprot:scaffold23173_cov86-Cyclotella_meneghiniana.AAC.2
MRSKSTTYATTLSVNAMTVNRATTDILMNITMICRILIIVTDTNDNMFDIAVEIMATGYQHEDLTVVERCSDITYGHCEKPLNAAKIHSTIAVIVVEIQ